MIGRCSSACRKTALFGLLLTAGIACHATDIHRTLDDFSRPDVWTASGTDDIETSLRMLDNAGGKALCLDFDFHGVSGGATLRRALPITFPANYALSFDVRGDMPPNDLQLKLIDTSGDNVWWYRRENFQPSRGWQTITAQQRDIESAWGPAKDRVLRRSATLEFTVYAGQGGKGELCFAHLAMQRLPAEPTAGTPPPISLVNAPNRFFENQARRAPRGMYPRGFSGEQSYWTLIGVDGGAKHSALISEDGAVEVRKGGWSIEPMIFTGHGVINWATVKTSQSLLDGYLPLPSVSWKSGELSLQITAFADGAPASSNLLLEYRLRNASAQPRALTLALLARPFQVNPPTQFLNTPGGTSPIHDLDWNGHALRINHDLRMLPLQAPSAFVASSYAAGALPQRLATRT